MGGSSSKDDEKRKKESSPAVSHTSSTYDRSIPVQRPLSQPVWRPPQNPEPVKNYTTTNFQRSSVQIGQTVPPAVPTAAPRLMTTRVPAPKPRVSVPIKPSAFDPFNIVFEEMEPKTFVSSGGPQAVPRKLKRLQKEPQESRISPAPENMRKNSPFAPMPQVESQIEQLLVNYAEVKTDTLDNFCMSSRNLMLFYNSKILPKDREVPFGHVLGVMRKKGLILPPEDPKVVTFVGEQVTKFFKRREKGSNIEENVSPEKKEPRRYTVSSNNRQNQQQNQNVRREKTADAFSRWRDTKKGNQVPHSPKNHCYQCGTTKDNNHFNSDEHKFAVLYKKLQRNSRSGGAFDDLSGKVHNLTIQSRMRKEGCKPLFLNFLREQERQVTIFDVVCKCGELGLRVENVSSFIIGSDKMTFRNFGRLNFNNKVCFSTVALSLNVEATYSEEFIVVLKFKKTDQAKTETEQFFVMKKITVRVDDDSTREDGVEIISKPSVLSEEPDEEKKKSDELVIEEDEMVKNTKPKSLLRVVRKLEEYPIPDEYLQLFSKGMKTDDKTWSKALIAQSHILEDLLCGLTRSNYSRYFSLMLYLEEHQTISDLREYTMRDAKLKKDKGLYVLEVPGLSENRPSVLKYDMIFITLPSPGKTHVGKVLILENSRIKIKMGPKFENSFITNMSVTVSFSFNRNSIRAQHRALELMQRDKMVSPVCFPSVHSKFVDERPILSWFNKLVGQNPQQSQAVQNIVNGTSKPAPYLLFGPPGTGKTVTIVESIKQIWCLHENSHVLASAPSNSAADLLAERILQSLPPSQVLRLYSPSRDKSQVPEVLLRSCNFEGPDSYMPDLEYLKKFRVIVCTLICAGRLVTGGFPSGFFSHIFVDECGHALEPTALVPIAGLQGSSYKPSQIVLSGDPRQLGPVVRSPVAQQLGLGLSLLERLMDTVDIYQRKSDGEFDSRVLSKLVDNFRSHPDILKVPNELFYENDLKPSGERMMTHSATEWEFLPRQGFPLIFHGVSGKEDRDASSPSYFNISEVSEVVKYVEKVLDSKFKGQRLRPGDIGVVSPYRGQLSKIHRALERKGFKGVSVGSVEEFQGQERRVIIISTVRSDPAQLLLDRKFRIGFVKEPKRFNVAVTRAKALLVVVGNPMLLESDTNWRYLLKHIHSHGGYTGCPYTPSSHHLPTPAQAEPEANGRQSALLSNLRRLLKKNNSLVRGLENEERDRVFATDTTIEELMKGVKDLAFFTDDTSAIEKFVSPPIKMFEQ